MDNRVSGPGTADIGVPRGGSLVATSVDGARAAPPVIDRLSTGFPLSAVDPLMVRPGRL